jgi:hypothetical protein
MTHAQKRALVMFLTLPVLALSAFATGPSPFVSGELNVMPSPASTSELSLPAGSSVVDFDIWPTGPDAVILLHDSAGNHVVSWHAGDSGTSSSSIYPRTLPPLPSPSIPWSSASSSREKPARNPRFWLPTT